MYKDINKTDSNQILNDWCDRKFFKNVCVKYEDVRQK